MKISDFCLLNSTSLKKNESDKEYLYLDTANITNGTIDSFQEYSSYAELPSRARRKVINNSILYSTVRPNQRHFGILTNPPDNLIVSTGFCVIDVDEKIANPRYVYYYLAQESITTKLHAIAEQATTAYPSIKPKDLGDLDIDLPDLEKQNEIAKVLTILDEKIFLNSRINDNLIKQAESLYTYNFPFSISDQLPEGWNLGSLDQVIELHDSRRIPLSSSERETMEENYPYYGAASLMDYVEDFIFDGKYLLFGEDGTVKTEDGYPVLQYVWGKFWVNNHAHVLTGKNGYTAESLYMLLKRTKVGAIVTGAVQPKINQTNLKSLKVVIPPAELIYKFEKQISPMFSLIRQLVDENKKLAIMRDELLNNLIR